MTDTILRAVWNGTSVVLGTLFDLRRRKGEREHRAVCTVSSSVFGREITLKVNGE